jgi:hypothetical protein
VYYETDLAAYSGDLAAVQRNLATLAHTAADYSSTRALLWASFGNQLHVSIFSVSAYNTASLCFSIQHNVATA